MKFVYSPEGAEPREWDFNPNRLMNPEAEAIERHTGMTFEAWTEAVGNGSMLALHGLLFVLLKRTMPTLKWDEVEFCRAEVGFDYDQKEKVAILRHLRSQAASGVTLEADALATLADLEADDETVAAAAELEIPEGEGADAEGEGPKG